MRRPRRGSPRLRSALIVSAVLHAAAIGYFWASASRGAHAAALKVYAVNIVSPPAREAGEPAPERAPAAEEPAVETPAEPPPAPAQPQPAEPVRAQPQPPRPAPTPRPAPPKPEPPKPEPPKPTSPPQPRPTETRRQPETRPTPPPSRPTQPAAARPAEPAPRPAPSTGSMPSPTSAGGDNLAVRTEGAVCPSEAYCNNIAAQVKRYFRRPPDAYSDRGDVCFRIARNGSVSDLEVQRLRGSFAFRLALMEAVEQAGGRDEFGPLPREFGSDWLPVCVGVTPQM